MNKKKNFTVLVISIVLLFVLCSSVQYRDRDNEFKNEYFRVIEQIKKNNYVKKTLAILNKYNININNEQKITLSNLLYDLEKKYPHLSSNLFIATALVETGFDNNSIGSSGEITAVQFMQGTWQEVTQDEHNYKKGSEKDILYVAKMWYKYVNKWNTYFNGDLKKTILAYNAGRHNILKNCNSSSEIEQFKTVMYRVKNIKPYDEKVLSYYYQFNNIRV